MLSLAPATSASSVRPSPSLISGTPNFAAWSNAMRLVLAERLLNALVDDLPDSARYAPLIAVAKKLLGRVRFGGHDVALADPRVLGVEVAALPLPTRWTWAVALCEWVSESWDQDDVEQYEVGESFDEILHEMAGVDIEHLSVEGGTR